MERGRDGWHEIEIHRDSKQDEKTNLFHITTSKIKKYSYGEKYVNIFLIKNFVKAKCNSIGGSDSNFI